MKLIETKIKGVFVIELVAFEDDRGFYKGLWGKDEILKCGLEHEVDNIGLSYNKARGTLRGIHYQCNPFAQAKLVQCIRGSIFDVVLDIRRDSTTFGEWIAEELSAQRNRALYVPPGLAHGFQTLENDTEILYCISGQYKPQQERGVRWNDPQFGIKFPLAVTVINDRDNQFPDFQ